MKEGRSIATVALAKRLKAVRRQFVVGRESEKEFFATLLLQAEPEYAALYIYGPGGIGKTTLLAEFLQICGEDQLPIFLDARNLEPTPAGFITALQQHLNLQDEDPARYLATQPRRPIMFIDTYELMKGLDDWLREQFLPSLPENSLSVLAGRNPPGHAWRSDAAWKQLLRVISLRNLAPQDCLEYLRKRQIAEDKHKDILGFTYGHPLALSIVVDVLQQAVDDFALHVQSPDTLRLLLERFIREVPSAAHREALEICAHVRVTSETTLREALTQGDAYALFEWLRTLSFIQQGPEGLFPHDLARDVIDLDFRWRDPGGFRLMHERTRASILQRTQSQSQEAMRAIYDLFYLHRNSPIMKPLFIFGQIGSVPVERAKVSDEQAIASICETHLGKPEAQNARYWFKHQPEAFTISRDLQGEVLGFVCHLQLSTENIVQSQADPIAYAILNELQSSEGLRPAEVVLLQRFTLDKATKMNPSPVFNAFLMHMQLLMLTLPRLAFSVITIHAPELYETLMTYIDHHPMTAIKPVTGGATAFAHDWRKVNQQAWFELMGKREISLAQNPAELEPPQSEQLVLLSQQEFSEAVKRALRDYHSLKNLETNPLLRSRLVLDAQSETLKQLLQSSAQALAEKPKDEKFLRALNATFFEPAMTQELAAERLGLPFGTYRYQLNTGIERLVAQLWEQELRHS